MSFKDVSVIIPTYNRGYILYNTLLSLKYQTYPSQKFEVIVVDDGSTDDTGILTRKAGLDNLTVINLQQNMGDGVARNIGVSAAQGKLIVFCDSDFIVRPTHIANHVYAHQELPCAAVSGLGHWEYLLTYDFGPQWAEQKGLLTEYARPFIKERLLLSRNHNLITEEEIQRQELQPFRVIPGHPLREWETMFDQIIEQYGYTLDSFQCPWLSFCTGNVSISTEIFRELGGFDKQLPRMKDLEFGYRFFLAGGSFRYCKEAEAYMQITDTECGRKYAKKKALAYFSHKHNVLEVNLLSLDLMGQLNYHELSQVISQHYHLKITKPHLRGILHQFERMARGLAQDDIRPPLRRYLPPLLRLGLLDAQYHEIKNDIRFTAWLKYYNKLMNGLEEE